MHHESEVVAVYHAGKRAVDAGTRRGLVSDVEIVVERDVGRIGAGERLRRSRLGVLHRQVDLAPVRLVDCHGALPELAEAVLDRVGPAGDDSRLVLAFVFRDNQRRVVGVDAEDEVVPAVEVVRQKAELALERVRRDHLRFTGGSDRHDGAQEGCQDLESFHGIKSFYCLEIVSHAKNPREIHEVLFETSVQSDRDADPRGHGEVVHHEELHGRPR